MKRWLTVREVADFLSAKFPRVAKLSPKRRNEYALRLVRRMERREETKHTKRERDGKRVLVKLQALEELLPVDAATIDKFNENLAELNQENRQIRKTVNDHSARLRDHGKRIVILEEKQRLTTKFVADLNELERRMGAAE